MHVGIYALTQCTVYTLYSLCSVLQKLERNRIKTLFTSKSVTTWYKPIYHGSFSYVERRGKTIRCIKKRTKPNDIKKKKNHRMIIIMKLHSRRCSFGSQINIIIIFPRGCGTHACARDRQRPNLRTTLRNIATKTALIVTTVTLWFWPTTRTAGCHHRYYIPRLLLLLLLLRLGTPTQRTDGEEQQLEVQTTFSFVSSSAYKQVYTPLKKPCRPPKLSHQWKHRKPDYDILRSSRSSILGRLQKRENM